VAYNRDYEGGEADPENRARADIRGTVEDVVRALAGLNVTVPADTGVGSADACEVHTVGVTHDVTDAFEAIRDIRPVAVFNLCESIDSDNRFEPLLPMLLELEGLAYTGSGPLALTLSLHKDRAKQVLRAHGVSTPPALVISRPTPAGDLCGRMENEGMGPALAFPLIVKPSREDASVGISAASVVFDVETLAARSAEVVERYRQPALAEAYIEGREIYVSKLDDGRGGSTLFPFFEIDFAGLPAGRPHIVSFEGKWMQDSVDFVGTPSGLARPLDAELSRRVQDTARAAFDAIGIRDYGRVDIRLSADGTPFVIDVNPNCDLSATGGGFAKAARAAGLGYDDLTRHILTLALARRDADTIPIARRSRSAAAAGGRGRVRGPAVSPRGGAVRARTARGNLRPT
jgi:D-alanine-D-alanine ligase